MYHRPAARRWRPAQLFRLGAGLAAGGYCRARGGTGTSPASIVDRPACVRLVVRKSAKGRGRALIRPRVVVIPVARLVAAQLPPARAGRALIGTVVGQVEVATSIVGQFPTAFETSDCATHAHKAYYDEQAGPTKIYLSHVSPTFSERQASAGRRRTDLPAQPTYERGCRQGPLQHLYE